MSNLEANGWNYSESTDAPQAARVSSTEQVRTQVVAAMNYELGRDPMGARFDVPYADLIGEPEKPIRAKYNDEGQVTVPGSHRFRKLVYPIVLSGILQRVTAENLYKMVRGALGAQRMQLSQSQQNGAWVLVAWSAKRGERQMRARTDNPASMVNFNLRDDKPSPQRTVPTWATDSVLEIECVWWDANRGDEVDRWEQRTGQKTGAMQSWLTRGILPPVLQRDREQSLSLLRTFAVPILQARVVEGTYPSEPEVDFNVTPEEVKAIANPRKPKAPRKAPAIASELPADIDNALPPLDA